MATGTAFDERDARGGMSGEASTELPYHTGLQNGNALRELDPGV
jgi:hypothetical protein